MPRDLMEMLAPLFDQATKLQDIEGSQNLLFPKGFVKKRPRIASMVEGAVLGAALTKPSSTPGEGISNVAQAILSIPGFKKDKQMQKILAPLGMIQQGLEMQKLQAETGLAQARAEKLGRPDAASGLQKAGVHIGEGGDPFGFTFDPNKGTYSAEQISVPGGTSFDSTGGSAGTRMEREADLEDAERAARGEAPMTVEERRVFDNKWLRTRGFATGLGGAQGREIVTGPIRDRNELLRTEMSFANKEVAKLEKMDEFEFMMEDLTRKQGDLATALEQLRVVRSNYATHLRMGGSLSWKDFKTQRQGPVGGNPFRTEER